MKKGRTAVIPNEMLEAVLKQNSEGRENSTEQKRLSFKKERKRNGEIIPCLVLYTINS